jgi:hypothetical protein
MLDILEKELKKKIAVTMRLGHRELSQLHLSGRYLVTGDNFLH